MTAVLLVGVVVVVFVGFTVGDFALLLMQLFDGVAVIMLLLLLSKYFTVSITVFVVAVDFIVIVAVVVGVIITAVVIATVL